MEKVVSCQGKTGRSGDRFIWICFEFCISCFLVPSPLNESGMFPIEFMVTIRTQKLSLRVLLLLYIELPIHVILFLAGRTE